MQSGIGAGAKTGSEWGPKWDQRGIWVGIQLVDSLSWRYAARVVGIAGNSYRGKQLSWVTNRWKLRVWIPLGVRADAEGALRSFATLTWLDRVLPLDHCRAPQQIEQLQPYLPTM